MPCAVLPIGSPAGIALCILGLAFAALLEGACPFANADPDAFSAAALFIGIGIVFAAIIALVFIAGNSEPSSRA
jgi:L-lactate permease